MTAVVGAAGDPRALRLASVRAALRAENLDAMLVSSRANTRYLTGFSGSSSLLVVSQTETILISDFRYRAQARAECGTVAQVEIEGTSLWMRLWSVLPKMHGVTTVGFESAHMLHLDHQRLVDAGVRWHWQESLLLCWKTIRLKRGSGCHRC